LLSLFFWSWTSGHKVLVNGGLWIGQDRVSAEGALKRLGYRKSNKVTKGDLVVYEDASSVKRYRFLELGFDSQGKVSKLSGTLGYFQLNERFKISEGMSVKEVLSLLGKPSWACSVGDGDYGMYFGAYPMYLVFFEEKLTGIGLGESVAEPGHLKRP
jgi:hypothetical protein